MSSSLGKGEMEGKSHPDTQKMRESGELRLQLKLIVVLNTGRRSGLRPRFCCYITLLVVQWEAGEGSLELLQIYICIYIIWRYVVMELRLTAECKPK